MHVCIYVCTRTCMSACMWLFTCAFGHMRLIILVYIFVCMCVYVCIYIYIYIYIYVYYCILCACICVYMYVCAGMCMCVCIYGCDVCVCVYRYIFTHRIFIRFAVQYLLSSHSSILYYNSICWCLTASRNISFELAQKDFLSFSEKIFVYLYVSIWERLS